MYPNFSEAMFNNVKSKKSNNKHKMNHEKHDLETTRVLEPTFKYREVWQRAKRKLICSIRIMRFMEELTSSRINIEKRFQDYLHLKAGLFQRQTLIQKKKLPWGIIHPNNRFKSYWNAGIGFLLLYTAIVTPFSIAFLDTNTIDTWFILDLVINVFYICDVIINCSTAFYDKDAVLQTKRKEIILNYLKGWMIIDVLACLPIGTIPTIISTTSHESYNKLVRLFRLRSIPKLFRLSKAIKLIKTYRTNFLLEKIQIFLNINHSVMRLLALITGILVSLHVVGCFWYLASTFSANYYDSWIFRYGYQDSSIYTIYLTSVYWALTTLTSVGYGDIVPFSDTEIIFTILWMIATMYFLSFTVSSLSSVITMIDIKKKNLDIKLAMIDDYAKDLSVSKITKQKMQKRIQVISERLPLSLQEEEKLMKEIPKDLKFEIACNIFDGSIKNFIFFKNRDKEFLISVALFLQPYYFSKRDTIINRGELATEIFFILHGSVNFLSDEDSIFKVYNEGQEFGDVEVLLKLKRMHNVQAGCEVTLLVMKENYINKIKIEFPGIWKEMKEKAELKLKAINWSLAENLVLNELKNKIHKNSKLKSRDFKELVNSELNKINPFKKTKENPKDLIINQEIINQIDENYESIKKIKEELELLTEKIQKVLK